MSRNKHGYGAASDSVSQITARTSGSLGNGGTYEARNGVVVVRVVNVTQTGNKDRTIGTLPAGLRPSDTVFGVTNYSQYAGLLKVSTSGTVSVWAPYSGDYTGQVVFCV